MVKKTELIMIGGGIGLAAVAAILLSRKSSAGGSACIGQPCPCPPECMCSDFNVCVPYPTDPPPTQTFNFVIDYGICPSCVPAAGAWANGSKHAVNFNVIGTPQQSTTMNVWGRDPPDGKIYRVVYGTFTFNGVSKSCYAVNHSWDGEIYFEVTGSE